MPTSRRTFSPAEPIFGKSGVPRRPLMQNRPVDLLDNIMWNCMSGPHARFAVGAGDVRRYAPGFSPIIGCRNPEQPDFRTLEGFCEPGETFYVHIWSGEPPDGWQITREAGMYQEVWGAPAPEPAAAPDSA